MVSFFFSSFHGGVVFNKGVQHVVREDEIEVKRLIQSTDQVRLKEGGERISLTS